MWHSEFKLYLYPDHPKYITNIDNLVSILYKVELIEKQIETTRYRTGNQFTSLLTFMGCSPNIELEPQKNKPYCYIEIETRNRPFLITGKNTKAVRCLNCKEKVTTTFKNDELSNDFSCPNCGNLMDFAKLNWRKSAFFASNWITIGNIYELEAIPSDQLLNTLKNETGVNWKPAYIRNKSG